MESAQFAGGPLDTRRGLRYSGRRAVLALQSPVTMRILVTGPSGAIGAALARAMSETHELRALAREPARVEAVTGLEVVRGDALTGEGLRAALAGVEVAYYLIHSMEAASNATFAARDRAAAEQFAAAAARAGVRRIVYLGGNGSTGRRSMSRTIARNERERAPTTSDARSATLSGTAARRICATSLRLARWGELGRSCGSRPPR